MWELDYKECFMLKYWYFWSVLLEKTLEGPLDTRRTNQSILKEIRPQYSLKRLMLKLKLQYLATWCDELTHWERPSCWEKLKVGGEGDDRGWDGWMASPIQWIWVWANSGSWWWTGTPFMLQFMESQRVGLNWSELMEISLPSFVILFWTLAFNWCQGYHSHGAHLHSKGCNQKRSKYN